MKKLSKMKLQNVNLMNENNCRGSTSGATDNECSYAG